MEIIKTAKNVIGLLVNENCKTEKVLLTYEHNLFNLSFLDFHNPNNLIVSYVKNNKFSNLNVILFNNDIKRSTKFNPNLYLDNDLKKTRDGSVEFKYFFIFENTDKYKKHTLYNNCNILNPQPNKYGYGNVLIIKYCEIECFSIDDEDVEIIRKYVLGTKKRKCDPPPKILKRLKN